MSADELRARFSQVAEAVVPMEDPHGRLMSRRRKQVRGRIASLTTLTAAVIAGGLAAPTTLFSVAADPPPGPEIVATTSSPTREEYVDQLIKAPVRGNLSSDPEMVTMAEKAFAAFLQIHPKATNPKLVFLNRTDKMLQAVATYTERDQLLAVASGATLDGSVKELVSDRNTYVSPVTPFLVLPVSDMSSKLKSVVGLAPPGCTVEHSAKGGFGADGTLVRSYEPEPTGDYVVRDGSTVNELWRVSCDGRVHEVRTADDYLDSSGAETNATLMYDRVVRFSGMAPGKGSVQWEGYLPGRKLEAMLVSPYPLRGPAMLAIGPFLKAVLATDLPEKGPTPRPTTTGRDEEWSMVSLGVANEGLAVVRIPQQVGNRTVLGDQVFVYSEDNAAKVEAVDSEGRVLATASLEHSVAILTFGPGLASAVRAVTERGTPAVSVRFTELAKGSQLLGDRLFKDW